MYIQSTFHDSYDYTPSITPYDKSDTFYDRKFKSRVEKAHGDLVHHQIMIGVGYKLYYFESSIRRKYSAITEDLYAFSRYIDGNKLYEEYGLTNERGHYFYGLPFEMIYQDIDQDALIDRSAKTGRIIIPRFVKEFMRRPEFNNVIETKSQELRDAYNIEAPLFLVTMADSRPRKVIIYENFCFATSNIDIALFSNVIELAADLDAYVSMQKDVDINPASDKILASNNGFDDKSFKKRSK